MNPNILIEDDWDSVVDAYNLDKDVGQLAQSTSTLNDNACLRIIKTKYVHQKEETFCLRINLVYSNDLLADILTNSDHFNQFKMSRYTLTYDNLDQNLFERLKSQACLDFSKCASVKHPDSHTIEIEINVKNQAVISSNHKKQNMNELFKFTC